MVEKFITIDLGSITAGGTVESKLKKSESWKIVKIKAIEKNDNSLANVTATIRIANNVKTDEVVPLSVFQGDENEVPELNWEWKAGDEFVISVTNNGTATVNVFIVLQVEKLE